MKRLFAIIALVFYIGSTMALDNNDKVPILLYHSWTLTGDCGYGSNDIESLAADLETMHDQGFTVVPVYWLAEWALGWRDGSTLPAKPVGITLDDGNDRDFLDDIIPGHACAPLRSVYSVLKDFRDRHGLPYYNAHASTFVIGSREVRRLLDSDHFNDNWWSPAQHAGLIEVYNHGMDHDHNVITGQLYEPTTGNLLPASGHSDGNWSGIMRPDRINNLVGARTFIADSAEYIHSKTGAWPDLFAHPMGLVSQYVRDVYLPNYFHEHSTVAAFCTERAWPATSPANYLSRSSHRYCMPRLTHGGAWKTPEEFINILQGSGL